MRSPAPCGRGSSVRSRSATHRVAARAAGNLDPGAAAGALPLVVATPKPRLVKLAVTNARAERFSTGGTARRATHYVLKVELGGLAGFFAPLVGKQPPDSHVWILGGAAPAFVRSEQPLYVNGPMWRIDLLAPDWPDSESARPEARIP